MPIEDQEIDKGYHVRLYTDFAKRVNSTKRPDLEAYERRVAFYAKLPFDCEAPQINIRYNSLEIAPQWTYAYIDETESYYWVTRIETRRANWWFVSMTIDPLATYKEAICDTDAYIEYGFNSDASGAALRLQDTRQNISNNPTVITATSDFVSDIFDISEGCYILQAVGQNSVGAYAMTNSELSSMWRLANLDIDTNLTAALAADTPLQAPVNIMKYIGQHLVFEGSAFQSIRSCIWVPLSVSQAGQFMTGLTLGGFQTGLTVHRVVDSVNARKIAAETDIEIPWPVEDWKRMNCILTLYVPMFGTISIPVDKCNDADNIHLKVTCDPLDGTTTLHVTCNEQTLYLGGVGLAVSYAIGSSNVSARSMASGVLQMVEGGFSAGGGVLGAINPFDDTGLADVAKGLTTTAEGYLQTVTPTVTCIGNLGGSSALLQDMTAKLTIFYYPPVDDAGFQSVYGYPVMRVTKPTDGYCKTRGFSCQEAKAMVGELSYINRALDSGVFIE